MKYNYPLNKVLLVTVLIFYIPSLNIASTDGENPGIKFLRKIGNGNTENTECKLQIPTDVGVNSNNIIIIIDAGIHKLCFLDSAGNFISQIGGKGSKSSEFNFPYSIDINSKGEMFISDLGNNRIQIFSEKGKFVNQLPFTTGNMRLNNHDWISITKSHGFFSYVIPDPDVFSDDWNINLLTLKGETKLLLSEKYSYNNLRMNNKGNEVFVDIDNENNILVAYQYRNLIEKYDSSGNLLWSKNPKLNFQATISVEEKQKDTFQEIWMNKCHSGVAADDKGNIWVVTLNRQLISEEIANIDMMIMRGFDGKSKVDLHVSIYEGPQITDAFKIDVFNSLGEFQTSIPLTHFVDNIRIFNNTLFLIDTYHNQQIYQYEIVN